LYHETRRTKTRKGRTIAFRVFVLRVFVKGLFSSAPKQRPRLFVLVAVIVERAGQFAEDGARQTDRLPPGAAYAHVRLIGSHRHGAEEVALAVPGPDIDRVFRNRHRGSQLVHEEQQTQVVRAEEVHPASQAVDVLARGPAFPDASLAPERAAGKAPALDVHQQPGSLPQDDEIQVLDRPISQKGAARLIDTYIAEPVPLQVAFKSGFVMVAAIHGSNCE